MRELRWYMSLPWTIHSEIRKDKGTYYVIRVDELPGLLVTGRNDREVEQNFWEALESHLLSYLKQNEEPPIPEIIKDRLEVEPSPSVQRTGQPSGVGSGGNFVPREEPIPVYA